MCNRCQRRRVAMIGLVCVMCSTALGHRAEPAIDPAAVPWNLPVDHDDTGPHRPYQDAAVRPTISIRSTTAGPVPFVQNHDGNIGEWFTGWPEAVIQSQSGPPFAFSSNSPIMPWDRSGRVYSDDRDPLYASTAEANEPAA